MPALPKLPQPQTILEAMPKLTIPEAIRQQTQYKRKYGPAQMFDAFVQIPSALGKMLGNRGQKLVSNAWVERIQLAVTEVSGCAACSYAHTYMALKQGMSQEEISSFLSADGQFVRAEEAKSILFAQHFAEMGGRPRQAAYRALVDEYGPEKAQVIFAAAQLMIVGNISGLPFSALLARLDGKPYADSTLFYELGMQVAGFLGLPLALALGLLALALPYPGRRLSRDQDH